MAEDYYPENLMPIVRELEVRYQRFSELREKALLGYGYNTARAYWSDLDDWCMWAMERNRDVLALTEKDVRQYIALMRRRKYSENTIRRRVTALRKLYASKALDAVSVSPSLLRPRGTQPTTRLPGLRGQSSSGATSDGEDRVRTDSVLQSDEY